MSSYGRIIERVLSIFWKSYPFLLILFLFTYLVRWPIYAGDTDLWYHLDGGRYIIENFSVPKESYFSFMEPKKEWVDYYWLFQVLVYSIYSVSGYTGLVVLRLVLLLSTLLILFLFLSSKGRHIPFFSLLLFSLYLLFFVHRFFLIRPHMFTYLFIALFIYIFEEKREVLFLIPFLCLLWVNLHGIEYPVMLLIVISYLFEIFLQRKGTPPIRKKFLLVLFFSLLSVLLTPNGFELPHIPFIPTGFASLYIGEIRKITLEDMLSFHFSKLSPSYFTIFNLLFLAILFCFLSNLFKKHLRVAPLLLFFCGLLLLTKANRFTYEFVLLSLPIFKDHMSNIKSLSIKDIKSGKILFIVLFLLIPFLSLKLYFKNLPPFPFSSVSLPEGICMFLKKVERGGNILNHPNTGGYLRFMLYPRYKIFMDMEVPFLFTNEDMYIAMNAFTDSQILKGIIERYDPDFITVSIKNVLFRGIIKDFDKFKPVFFDEVEVLFANRERHPDLVRTYELKFIDPFSLAQVKIGEIERQKKYKAIKEELLRGLNIYPDCAIRNLYLGEIYYLEGNYEKTIFHADRIIGKLPHIVYGYTLKAKALKALKDYDEAENLLNKALRIESKREDLLKELALLHYERGDYKKAYKILKAITNPFSSDTNYKDLYFLISSAFYSGEERDAEILLPYGLKRVPEKDKEWMRKYEELRGKMK